ncbi:MAG: diaminopropionate ammonia-lyase [Herpetosiphon sp.]
MPGYAPTPLVDAPLLAATLGVGRVSIKDESVRLGLPSFKILGASWAVYRALSERYGGEMPVWASVAELAHHLAVLHPLTLVAATDGNHGRAVAYMARLLGVGAHIFVPAEMVTARRAAIADEGATVTVVDGSYDEAVERAAQAADDQHLVISDTSWPGYEQVPRWVIEGYATIFLEIDEALEQQRICQPDLVAVQIGVGALAAAVVYHYRRAELQTRPMILGVEPVGAACVLRSMETGRLVALSEPPVSIMAGLNCGIPSSVAWPLVSTGIDVFVAIDDEQARRAMRDLADAGVVAGETGAAALGGVATLVSDGGLTRMLTDMPPNAHVLVLSTEGATDPAAYNRIVGQRGCDLTPRMP